jgi:anti-sigma factor RsiW
MSECSFERLLKLLDNRLDPIARRQVNRHLNRCDVCRDAVYQLASDWHGAAFRDGIHRFKRWDAWQASAAAG